MITHQIWGDYSEYQYDTWNRLITETRHILNEGYTISYQYDTANRLTAMVYPDSTQILYMYDDLNRTTEIRRYIDGILLALDIHKLLYSRILHNFLQSKSLMKS
jgi:YD repeat-containing protein